MKRLSSIIRFVLLALSVQAAGGRLEAALWIKGCDVSSIPKSEALGGVYAYANGAIDDPVKILKAGGVNALRLKVWLNSPDGYNGKTQVVAMAVRAKAQGMSVLLDFHYSDSWADPGKQNKPAAWVGHTLAQLKTDVYDHTFDVCAALVAAGAAPDYVQIGNEINDGMLWPEGRISTNGNSFANLAELLKQGVSAVHAAAPSAAVILHIAKGGDWGTVKWWFDGVLAQGVTWDYTGVSYYPYWHGTLSAMQSTITSAASRYGKPVVLCETAYPFTLAAGDGQANNIGLTSQLTAGYPATAQGQHDMMKAIMDIVNGVPNGRGAGVFYWEGTWTPVAGNGWDNTNAASGNGWENQALFDFSGNALTSLAVFREFPGWQAAHFNSLELADPAISGDAADPDADGLSNVIEFALGLNPRRGADAGALAPVRQMVESTPYLCVTFWRRVPAVDLTYTVLTSASPAGPWVADAVQVGNAVPTAGEGETVTYRDSQAMTGSGGERRFLKVQITRTP